MRREWLHPENGQYGFVERYVYPQDDMLKALLAERARRDGVFARLMEVAREEIDNSEDAVSHQSSTKMLDALQREWEGK